MTMTAMTMMTMTTTTPPPLRTRKKTTDIFVVGNEIKQINLHENCHHHGKRKRQNKQLVLLQQMQATYSQGEKPVTWRSGILEGNQDVGRSVQV
jgi:3-phenylpropionate/cinnamic acid dioxygenase small subunit